MKKLEELGISQTPWVYEKNVIHMIRSGDRIISNAWIGATDSGLPAGANARLITAAPKLYSKAYEVAENLLAHLNVPMQSITMNRAEVAAMVKDLQSALAEAAGESEVK